MSDLISRQDAVDVAKQHWYKPDIAKALEELPSVQSDLITQIQNGIKATDADDAYSCGMRNGMRWCISLIDDKEPLYENCPSAQQNLQPTCNKLATDTIDRQSAIDTLDKHLRMTDVPVSYPGIISALTEWLNELPSAQTEWNNHTVACLLAELFDDDCACNYNGIDEWLPEKCEVIDACPNPVGVACWEQYLKHRAERREK